MRATIERIVGERLVAPAAALQGMGRDKGYDYQEVRDILQEFEFTAHIRAEGKKPRNRLLKHGVKRLKPFDS